MSSEQIVLLDLPTKAPRSAWSLNPWRTRLVLNYKGLDYRTEWVEYHDIKRRLEKHVASNNTEIPYTIPTIQLPSGDYVTDSRQIATALEAAYPSPSLHLDSPILPRVEAIMHRLVVAMYPVFIPRVPQTILADAAIPYWMESREGWFGPLDKLAAEGSEGAWAAMGPLLKDVTELLREGQGKGKGGPFFMGREVSYADFLWGAFLVFCQRLGPDVMQGVLEGTGDAKLHEGFLEALAPWTARADH
ncbi:putative glutathione S-transferase [Trichocladium antarcticum]|uniref:Glutathione S-transferase n=1 Tax=Trichocladium antarcticum TaxID=1450529 RepID=A0AAN6ZEY8_9PEZI|nr:putative glutathione S-transferase [Trichocladium antarcticum]